MHKAERVDLFKRYILYKKDGFRLREIIIFENLEMVELNIN